MDDQMDFFNRDGRPSRQPTDHPLFQSVAPHIVSRFWEYHQLNPQVFELFRKFALQLLEAGRKSYGLPAIAERIRWHFAVETRGDNFKLNNNYRSCYARLLMIEDPRFKDFFEIRSSPGAERITERP